MDERIGSVVKTKIDLYPDVTVGEPIKVDTKGMVYSILPENFNLKDENWLIIFQSGEVTDFCDYEREKYLEMLDYKISGSDRNKIHNKKLSEVINDIVKKRIKL